MGNTKFTMLVDDIDIEDFGIRLVNYETSAYVGRKVKGVDVPGSHGARLVPSALTTSGFFANVVCTGKDADEVHNLIRQFFAYMYSRQDSRKIVFTDDSEIVRYAVLDSPEKYRVINGVDNSFAQMKLTFLMMDPFMYYNTPDKFVSYASHGEEKIVVNDALECQAVFTLTNITDSFISDIGLIINGELASFKCDLPPQGVLVLDTVEYEVRLNGEHRLDVWSGEMPGLRNGENVIVQQNTQHYWLQLTVEFTKQWV